jgi:hypothetical protein
MNPLLAGTIFVVPAPSAIVAGNLLLAICPSAAAETWTPPSGFTLFGTEPLSGNNPQISIYTKTATASEPSVYPWQTNNGATDSTLVGMLNISGTPTPSINGMFSKYVSGAPITVGTAAVSIPTVLNCLPIAINSLTQLNPSNAGNPTSLTAGWNALPLIVNQDITNYGNNANNNGYAATYIATGPLTVNTSSAITAGWTWGGASSTFTSTSVMLFVAP